MCISSPKTPAPLPPPKPIEEKEPDLQITSKKSRDKKKGSSKNSSLNRFLLVPGSTGSGANIPE
jgi:hypothetical protein